MFISYLIYESSKGRKDLVFVSSSKELAFSCCEDWSKANPSFTYRVYAVEQDNQCFYIDKLYPIREYRKGLPF